ncbi:hypothetical protein EPO05_00220 [Patescibacteria group bacterium]|nr:MAG: hypothetical protein EPO05_00220 [Patescibacteria group bacterium]
MLTVQSEGTIPDTQIKPNRSTGGYGFFQNSLVHWMLIAACFLNVGTWLAMAFFVRPVDYPIILHYNVYFGVDIMGDWWQAYSLPGVALVFLLINLSMAYTFYARKERIAAYLFLIAAFFVQLGITIASATIIRINY